MFKNMLKISLLAAVLIPVINQAEDGQNQSEPTLIEKITGNNVFNGIAASIGSLGAGFFIRPCSSELKSSYQEFIKAEEAYVKNSHHSQYKEIFEKTRLKYSNKLSKMIVVAGTTLILGLLAHENFDQIYNKDQSRPSLNGKIVFGSVVTGYSALLGYLSYNHYQMLPKLSENVYLAAANLNANNPKTFEALKHAKWRYNHARFAMPFAGAVSLGSGLLSRSIFKDAYDLYKEKKYKEVKRR